MRYVSKPVEVEAVRFKGSSSQASAIESWLDGGPYIERVLNTRDICPMHIATRDGFRRVLPGAWVVKHRNGDVETMSEAKFQADYICDARPEPEQPPELEPQVRRLVLAVLDATSTMSVPTISRLASRRHQSPKVTVYSEDFSEILAALDEVKPGLVDSLIDVRKQQEKKSH